jgi:hypothetical protein
MCHNFYARLNVMGPLPEVNILIVGLGAEYTSPPPIVILCIEGNDTATTPDPPLPPVEETGPGDLPHTPPPPPPDP